MDSVYEHVHDDGNPIQGSGEVMNDFSHLTSAEEDKITPFDGHRTTTDMSRRLRAPNRTLDPLKRLPPELSTFVITQALPPHDTNFLPSMYPSRLIELTTVSKKWQGFLSSTPVLWSEIYIDERQEDLLATLSVFIMLSRNAPLKLSLRGEPIGIDWTELTSVLLPGAERVACLQFGSGKTFGWAFNALSSLLERLCRLPQLKEVNFTRNHWARVTLLDIKSLGLPPSIHFSGLFFIKLPKNCWKSGTNSGFFDVTKCNTLGTLGQLVPPSQPDLLLLEFRTSFDESNVISSGATLGQLESLAVGLAESNCFEQVIYKATFLLRGLEVYVDLSQTEDLLDCLRMLMHLQRLDLQIGWADRKFTRDHTLSDTTSRGLRLLQLTLLGDVGNQIAAQKPLADLFSALGILYPGVEEVSVNGDDWVGSGSIFLQSLRALKSLGLTFERSPLALPPESITLQSVQHLEIQGVPRLDNLHAPNLLTLVLKLGDNVTVLEQLGPFPRGLQSLEIAFESDVEDFNLTYLDCPDLRDLHLKSWQSWQPHRSWGCPWLPNLVSIKVEPSFRCFTDPSGNQLCIALLCYPWRLPSLQKLHFGTCVEWDVLFLMLKRRNCEGSGVQRIDTVTLPFIPFAFHKLLARLLSGEIVELPSLISLSLEATREVMFDSSVPGCFSCMRHMRPGCTAMVAPVSGQFMTPADMLYPPEEPIPEETPQEIRDWLRQRWELVEMWKASYKDFTSRFDRYDTCSDFPRVWL